MTTPEQPIQLLSRQQVLDIQRKEPPSPELIAKFNQWILGNSFCGRCTIHITELQLQLDCFVRQLQSLLLYLQGLNWQITNNNGILEFY